MPGFLGGYRTAFFHERIAQQIFSAGEGLGVHEATKRAISSRIWLVGSPLFLATCWSLPQLPGYIYC
jgi:hypothetical protein